MRSPLQIWQFWRSFHGVGSLSRMRGILLVLKAELIRNDLITGQERTKMNRIINQLNSLSAYWKENSKLLKPKKE